MDDIVESLTLYTRRRLHATPGCASPLQRGRGQMSRERNPVPNDLPRSNRPVRRGRFLSQGLYAIGMTWGMPALSQLNPVYSDEATQTCLAQSATESPSLSGHAVLACVGRSAQRCMNTPGGDSTVGMMDCLREELNYWDRRLNAAYTQRMASARKEDASMASIRATTASMADSLRSMQRAWIRHLDAACLYEQAQWLGGTGGGPATMTCHMQETARQALKLEGWWAR